MPIKMLGFLKSPHTFWALLKHPLFLDHGVRSWCPPATEPTRWHYTWWSAPSSTPVPKISAAATAGAADAATEWFPVVAAPAAESLSLTCVSGIPGK